MIDIIKTYTEIHTEWQEKTMIVTLSLLQQTPMTLAICSQKLSGSVPVFLEKTYIMNTMSVTVYEVKDV